MGFLRAWECAPLLAGILIESEVKNDSKPFVTEITDKKSQSFHLIYISRVIYTVATINQSVLA